MVVQGERNSSYSFIIRHLMERVVSITPGRASPPVKGPPVPMRQKAGWAPFKRVTPPNLGYEMQVYILLCANTPLCTYCRKIKWTALRTVSDKPKEKYSSRSVYFITRYLKELLSTFMEQSPS